MCAATVCLEIWKQRHGERAGLYRVPNQFGRRAEMRVYARSLLVAHSPIPRFMVFVTGEGRAPGRHICSMRFGLDTIDH